MIKCFICGKDVEGGVEVNFYGFNLCFTCANRIIAIVERFVQKVFGEEGKEKCISTIKK
jgi:DNA-directed RNA polymerase subunit N (RpoN/RPB10)